MTAQTYSARMVARLVSKAVGREVSDKRVRAWVRDNVPAFDDDGYTTHAYDARTRDAIVKALTARYSARATGTAGRASSASNGRKGAAAPKRTRKSAAPKVTPEATPDTTPDA